MSGGQIIGLLAIVFIFGGPMIVGIVYAVVNGWTNVQKHREDSDLKHKLIDAGFSAEEIERIIKADRKPDDDDPQMKAYHGEEEKAG